MRVLVAGATGAIGRQLVPQLLAAGHDVVGTSSRTAGLAVVEALGARAALMDGLDKGAVRRVVLQARPEVVVHQMTALGGSLDLRHFARTFEDDEPVAHVRHGRAARGGAGRGARAGSSPQSIAGWAVSPRTGSWVKTEDEPLDPTPVPAMAATHAAIRRLEAAVAAVDWGTGVVLRYGGFVGPGTSFEPDGEQARMITRRRFPVVGDGAGMFSLVDVRGRGGPRRVLAVAGGPGGIYHVANEPVPVRELLPALAASMGAKPAAVTCRAGLAGWPPARRRP